MFNLVVLTGRLTADPELKTTNTGISVTSFSIAVNRRYRAGEETQTDFINIVAWRQTAEFITNYFKKDLTENCKTDRDRAVFMEEIVKNLDEFRTQVDDLKRKYIKDSRREFFGHLATEVVSQYENIFNIITDDYPTAYAVLSFCHEGKDYVIRIDIEGEKLYCQAQYNKSKVSDKIFYSFSESLIAKTLEKKILKKPSDWCRYRYFENGNEEEKQLEAKRCFLEAAKCCADLVKYNN